MGKIKHIRWIAVIGLLAIIELQYVWLTNTYKLTEESLLMKSDALFKDAALQEVFCRMEKYKKMMSSKDTTFTMSVHLEEDPDTLSADMMENNASQWLMSSLHIAFQKTVLKELKMEVSLTDLDSIYTHILDSIDIHAKVFSCVIDSSGNVIRSSGKTDINAHGTLKTTPVPINFEKSRFLQGIITNPYWLIVQRMTMLLIATALIMVLVIGCIVYQIRIIIRQDKIAKLREDFSYAMIHDMKTPLSSILMGTQILETGRLDSQSEKKARYFRILREESEHLLALTNKVLTLSKLENHRLKLTKTDCPLRPLLEDLAEKYKANAPKKVTYVWNLTTETVYADHEFLKEALSNLIDNAVKYSGEEVEIILSSGTRADGTDYISIRDNGFGIPLKEQSKIFEKYERASATERNRKGGATGFGLGLNYVFRVAEAHDGQITVESIEGEYSVFTLLLPSKEKAEKEKI